MMHYSDPPQQEEATGKPVKHLLTGKPETVSKL
jgi:hypothetical protein